MSVCCSVGYEGSNATGNGKDTFIEYDISCPQLSKDGTLNFWKSSCLQKIGNRDIPCCYLGCEEAAKHPELKSKMDEAIAKEESLRGKKEKEDKFANVIYNRMRYRQSQKKQARKPKLSTKERATLVEYYINGYTIPETVKAIGYHASTISLYRRLYRDGVMDRNGVITL